MRTVFSCGGGQRTVVQGVWQFLIVLRCHHEREEAAQRNAAYCHTHGVLPPEPGTTAQAAVSDPVSEPLSGRNRRYLEQVRLVSCYADFRYFLKICLTISYFMALIPFLAGLIIGTFISVLMGFLWSLLIVVLIRLTAEAALLLVDIADISIDAAARKQE